MYRPTCILVDDEQNAIDRLIYLLEQNNQLAIIAASTKPREAISLIQNRHPDLIFVDVQMPQVSGFDIVKETRSNEYHPTYIFVTGYNDYAIEAIKAGAFDYLIKPVDVDELNECIERFFHQLGHVNNIKNEMLTSREKEIAFMVAQGKTSQDIGDILHISKHTVDTHRRNMKKK